MDRLSPVSLIVTALALALISVVAACGGGGPQGLTPEEHARLADYLQKIEAIVADAEEQSIAIDEEEFPGVFEESIPSRDYFEVVIGIREVALDRLSAVNPAPPIIDIHSELLDAGAKRIDALQSLFDALPGIESDAAFKPSLAAFRHIYVAAGFEQACGKLEAIAFVNDIDVEMQCENGFPDTTLTDSGE